MSEAIQIDVEERLADRCDIRPTEQYVSINFANAETCEASSDRAQAWSKQMEKKPRIGCAGLVRRGDALLLGKRDKDPNRGLWVLPGGGIEFGESYINTLRRELREEAGIEVEVKDVFNVYELINLPNEHRLIVYVNANHREGEPTPSSDLSEVRFFSTEELREMSRRRLISPFVENVLNEAKLL